MQREYTFKIVGQGDFVKGKKTDNFYTNGIESCVAFYAEKNGVVVFAHILSADYQAGKINEFLKEWGDAEGQKFCYYNTSGKKKTTDELIAHLRTLNFKIYEGTWECIVVNGKYQKDKKPDKRILIVPINKVGSGLVERNDDKTESFELSIDSGTSSTRRRGSF